MNHKAILTSTIIAFTIAAVFLAFVLQRQFTSADYWSVAFVDPAGTSYDVTITNNTATDGFAYTITDATDTLLVPRTSITVAPGETRTITPHLPETITSPLTITVTHDKNTHILRK